MRRTALGSIRELSGSNRVQREKLMSPILCTSLPPKNRLPFLHGALVLALVGTMAGCRTSGPPSADDGVNARLLTMEQARMVQTMQQRAEKTPNQQPVVPAPALSSDPKPAAPAGEALLLREGDTVRILFPGAPNLNTLAPIRRDGKISLPMVGEVTAAGVSPTGLEKELIKLYGPQLQVKEVTVALESSAYPVYVTGAVLRPGKIISDRPLSVLEAVMEAGGFDYSKANLKAVKVIRNENGKGEYFTINLKNALKGKPSVRPFQVKPADIVYVPERFTWF